MKIEDFTKHGQNKANEEAPFDWEQFKAEAIKRLSAGEELTGKDGVLTPLIKQIVEASLEGELEHHVAKERAYGKKNRKNGKRQHKKEYHSAYNSAYSNTHHHDACAKNQSQLDISDSNGIQVSQHVVYATQVFCWLWNQGDDQPFILGNHLR